MSRSIPNEPQPMEKNVETEKRNKPSRNVSPFLWIGFVVVLLSIAGLWFMNQSWSVDHIQVIGNTFTPTASIVKKAGVPLGVRPDSVKMWQTIHSIEELPWIKRADIELNPPYGIRIHVTERKPTGLLFDGEDRMLIDVEGVFLPLPETQTIDVPIVYGFPIGQAGDTLRHPRFLALASFLNQVSDDPFVSATISEVGITTEDGVLALSQSNAVKLVFGKNEFESKIQIWKAFYRQVILTEGAQAFASLDFRYREQVIATRN